MLFLPKALSLANDLNYMLRSTLLICLCCLGFFSCKKSGDGTERLVLSHTQDTIGARLVLKGGPFGGALSEYKVIFNDRETSPSQRLSSVELEVVVPVQARSGIVTLKGPNGTYSTLETFYVQSQQHWKRAADFPGEGRIRSTAFVIGAKAYVVAGVAKGNGGPYYKDMWEYDSLTDKWTRKADLPGTTRHMALAFVLNGKAYVGGGILSLPYDCAQDFYEYTPESNTWKKMASPPVRTDLCYGSAVSYRGQGYVFSEAEGRKTLVFDPTTNTWNNRAPWNSGVYTRNGTSFAIGNRLFFGLGTAQIPYSGSGDFISSYMYNYNPDANTWTYENQYVPAIEQSAYSNAFVYKDEAYIAFGDAGKLYAYNPNIRHWRQIVDQELGVSSLCSNFMIGSRGFVLFGQRRMEDQGSRKLWVIELDANPIVR